MHLIDTLSFTLNALALGYASCIKPRLSVPMHEGPGECMLNVSRSCFAILELAF